MNRLILASLCLFAVAACDTNAPTPAAPPPGQGGAMPPGFGGTPQRPQGPQGPVGPVGPTMPAPEAPAGGAGQGQLFIRGGGNVDQDPAQFKRFTDSVAAKAKNKAAPRVALITIAAPQNNNAYQQAYQRVFPQNFQVEIINSAGAADAAKLANVDGIAITGGFYEQFRAPIPVVGGPLGQAITNAHARGVDITTNSASLALSGSAFVGIPAQHLGPGLGLTQSALVSHVLDRGNTSACKMYEVLASNQAPAPPVGIGVVTRSQAVIKGNEVTNLGPEPLYIYERTSALAQNTPQGAQARAACTNQSQGLFKTIAPGTSYSLATGQAYEAVGFEFGDDGGDLLGGCYAGGNHPAWWLAALMLLTLRKKRRR